MEGILCIHTLSIGTLRRYSMVESLLRTKTYIPSPRANLVPRPHLRDRLESSFQQGSRIILISAPAGSGKTTLVSDWLRQAQHPAAWISLDEDDNDLSRFLTLLITTLQAIVPDISDTLLALARSSQDLPVKTILTELINGLDALASPFLLVFDDYDAVHTESIHKAINYLVDHCPPSMRVVLICRGDPPLSLTRWRARGQMAELRTVDLRFSPGETTLFFRKTAGLELSDQDMIALEQSVEGWAAGLQLVSLALQSNINSQAAPIQHEIPNPHRFLASLARTNQYIVDYLLEEVYNHQPRKIQSFLLQTSILDRLCASLSAFVIGDHWAMDDAESFNDQTPSRDIPVTCTADEAQSMLEHLERSNLFLIGLDPERRWYRYHPLFAGALAGYLRKLHPEWIHPLNQRASEWFEHIGLLSDAVEYALAGHDFERSARLVEQVADQLLWGQGEVYRILRWLGSIPAEVLRSHPRLLLLQAWVELFSNHIELVEPLVRAALDVLPLDQTLRTAYSSEAAAIQTELARLQGNLPMMLAKAGEARQLLAQLPAKIGPASVILGILAGAYRANGDAREAYRTYVEASRLMEVEGKMPPALISAGYQIQLLTVQGQLRQATHLYQSTLKWAEERYARSLPAFGLINMAMGDVLREQNNLVEAERLLREGIRISLQREGLADDTFDGYLSLARLLQASGDFNRAGAMLEQASQLAQKYRVPNAESQIMVWRVRFSMMRGETPSPVLWIQDQGLHVDEPIRYAQENEYLVLARCLIEQNLPDQAAQLLSRLLSIAEAGGRVGRSIEVLGLQALAFHQSGNEDQALASLKRAFEYGEPEGYVRVFVDEGPRMEKLLRLAVLRSISGAYVSMLLGAFKPPLQRPVQNIPGIQPLVEPLTGRELEVLRLISAGLTNREIASEFFVSLGTVKSHINKIYRKLEVTNRVRATARAKELNLL